MNVIWHHNIFINNYIVKNLFYIKKLVFRNKPDFAELINRTPNAVFLVCTYSYKIVIG